MVGRFLADRRGYSLTWTAAFLAFLLVPLLVLGIEIGRWEHARGELYKAADLAALAAAAEVDIPHFRDTGEVRLLPGAVHVGWDIAITPHGPLVVEANGYPYLALMQEHGPTLLPRAVEFYRYYGLLKRPAFSAPRADRTRRLEGER